MRKILRIIGISGAILFIPLVFIGALMKIQSWEGAALILTIGFLGSIIPVLSIIILLIDILSKTNSNN